MTLFYRHLANVPVSLLESDDDESLLQPLTGAFYLPEQVMGETRHQFASWIRTYLSRVARDGTSDQVRREKMNAVNPKYVLRNYMAQLAIDAANDSNYKLIDELFQLLKQPYSEQPEHQKWFAKRPDWARHKVGCSMLSCSS